MPALRSARPRDWWRGSRSVWGALLAGALIDFAATEVSAEEASVNRGQSVTLDVSSNSTVPTSEAAPPVPRDGGRPPDAPVVPESPQLSHPLLALGDELFLSVALLTGWGFKFWDWGTQPFHFENEHGFSDQSATGGADKMGHFLTAQTLGDLMAWRLREKGYRPRESAFWGAGAGFGAMLWIELGDATSNYGFSYEDLVADALGASVALARNASPAFRALVDFRLQYWPTSGFVEGDDVSADYSGMRFLMAAKLAGIPWVGSTPLRFVEAHFGYFSRGYRSFDDELAEEDPYRAVYWGVGLNVNELLGTGVPDFIRTFFSYYQVPFLSYEVQRKEYR